MTIRDVSIREEPIELCQMLKFAGLTGSGGEAKQLIAEGSVSVNGAVETRKRRKLVAGDVITCNEQSIRVTLA
jgi:ribosome-associated protein